MKHSFSGAELRGANPTPTARSTEKPTTSPEQKPARSARIPVLTFIFFILAVAAIVWFLKTDKLKGASDRKGTPAESAQSAQSNSQPASPTESKK